MISLFLTTLPFDTVNILDPYTRAHMETYLRIHIHI